VSPTSPERALPCLRFVIEDDVLQDDIQTGLAIGAAAAGLSLSASSTREERPDYHRRIWTMTPGEAYAELVDDGAMATRWLGLCAPLSILPELQADLAGRVRWIDRERLLAAARSGSPRDVVRLALGTNALWDPDVAALLAEATCSRDVDMRAAAAEAMYLLRWPGLLSIARDSREREQDPGVRAMLREVEQRYA
jgi:hypothetical protein